MIPYASLIQSKSPSYLLQSPPPMNTNPTLRHVAPSSHSQDIASEERIWAVLSHLSALTLGIGILLPIVGWSDLRRKSNYGAFQNLQALGYQSLGFSIWLLGFLVLIVVALTTLIAVFENLSAVPRSWLVFISIVLFGFFALYLLLPMIGAVACAFGKDFRYPVLGDRLARYLEYKAAEGQVELNEDHEFRWVAAMGHFSILILLWGMLAPFTTWALYGKRTPFLRFQAIQTLVYQAGVTILLFIGALLSSLGLGALYLLLGSNSSADFNPPLGTMGSVMIIGLMLFAIVILLIVPLFHILGQWAGYRVLKGEDYHYPFVGRLVDKWISKNSATEEKLI